MRNLSIKALAWAQNRRSQEEGQTVIEYALVAAVISVALIIAAGAFGTSVVTAAVSKVAGQIV